MSPQTDGISVKHLALGRNRILKILRKKSIDARYDILYTRKKSPFGESG